MEFSTVIGALPNFVGKMKDGLTKAGTDKAEYSAKMLAFCASDALATAVYEYALTPAIPMDKVTRPEPGMRILIDKGWVFTVKSVQEVEVDHEHKPEALFALFGFSDPHLWRYRGTNRKSGRRKEITVIGYLNQEWTSEIVGWLVNKPGCRLKASGGWVMESFHFKFPQYRMPGVPEYDNHFLSFPGDPSSQWELIAYPESRGKMLEPQLCFVDGKWRDQFGEVQFKHHPELAPLCLIWE